MLKITFKTLIHGQSVNGIINGVKVKMTVDLHAGNDRTFKLRSLDINSSKGWDYGANHSDCYAVLNNEKTLQDAFQGF